MVRRRGWHGAGWPDLGTGRKCHRVRVAVDQDLSDLSAPLAGVREVAFFPPMTGG
ncbi:hypothetical protein CNY89_14270 [Amaricoccus sp. HAR-UPW-R2A-40]|nr:hypothetical protein CNY89_14270 [Amaricoccus sp. HAR-UPW-R2A-40]